MSNDTAEYLQRQREERERQERDAYITRIAESIHAINGNDVALTRHLLWTGFRTHGPAFLIGVETIAASMSPEARVLLTTDSAVAYVATAPGRAALPALENGSCRPAPIGGDFSPEEGGASLTRASGTTQVGTVGA